jgi:hypothetical protein
MTRAAGKARQQPRAVTVDPDSGEGREIGMSDRMQGAPSPIPGGAVHVVNAESMRQHTPAPDAPPEIKPINAHGVPPGSATTRERADLQRGTNGHSPPRPHVQPSGNPPPPPVPVYVVEMGDNGGMYRSSAPRSFLLPAASGAAAGDPVRLCGREATRRRILLLNESTSSDIRFAQRPSDLNGGGGALLPWPGNSYLTLHTQDELWAVSADTGTPKISIIQEFDLHG